MMWLLKFFQRYCIFFILLFYRIFRHIHDMSLYYTLIAICMHVWARRKVKYLGRYTNATGMDVYVIIDIEKIPCLGIYFMQLV